MKTERGDIFHIFAGRACMAIAVCLSAVSCAPSPALPTPALTAAPADSPTTSEPTISVSSATPHQATVVAEQPPTTFQASATLTHIVPIEPVTGDAMTMVPSTPTPTPTPAIWPTVTRLVLPAETAVGLEPCARRIVDENDSLVFVTQQFGLPDTFTPPDLVPLSDYFSAGVTVGIDSYVRVGLIEPLRRIIEDMHAAGLSPSILSGFRSYDEQYLAWKWWNSQYPERVAIMSARAGHSEHQLGTTVDFGSPALDHLFHVDFAQTPEGVWLAENAHHYGFTMSYPADTYPITGFKYEPWHYRYVGVELATALYEAGQTLTEWQNANLPPPCIP